MPTFDPFDPNQFKRLRAAMKENYRQMKPFRTVRELLIKAARGHYYKSGEDDPTAIRDPVNMMDQYVQTLVRSFVQSIPRSRVTSRTDPRTAKIFEAQLNITAQEIDLIDTLRKCIQEAILGYMGICYCGIAPTRLEPLGEPFADPIGLPNFVMDISKDERMQSDFMGHRFSRRIDELRDTPSLWNAEQLAKIEKTEKWNSELYDGEERHMGVMEDQLTLFDWTDIWALHVPTAEMIIYVSDSNGADGPLRVETYDGPEFGPYVFLGFDDVLDEMLPNSRGAMMLDMHDFVNGQYTRMFMKEDQAAEFFVYQGGSEEDARQYRDAQDGEFRLVNDINGVKRVLKGGTNPQSMAVAIHGRQLFDELSGNIRRTGGASSTADTATEARLDMMNTSRLIRDMQLQVIKFTKEIFQNIAWYEWTHPTRTRRLDVKMGENGLALEFDWEPSIRQGDFVEHEIDIIPDSLEHRSSRQQLTELMQAVQGVVIPAMQMPSGSPVILKTPELIQKYSELANLPELAEIADYALDDSFVSNPQAQGSALRIPAGATSEGRLNGGARQGAPGSDGAFVERVLSGAVAGNQQQEGPV